MFTECTLDNLQVICTCDTAVEIEPTIPPKPIKQAPIIYIVAIVNDDGIGALYTYVESFYNEMVDRTANMEVQPDFRLVHRAAGELFHQLRGTRARRTLKTYTCEDDGSIYHHYIVTDIAGCIGEYGSFNKCFHRKVPDSANVICVGNAYHAMYENLARESNRVALQFSVHPFSNQNERRFLAEDVYKFSKPGAMSYKQLLVECNKDQSCKMKWWISDLIPKKSEKIEFRKKFLGKIF